MIYEYQCKNPKCEICFEFEQSIKDDPKIICPKCKRKSLKRLISNTIFLLKGKGWFKDGY